MVEQLFDGFRKASESSLQMQQEMLKHWTQQWTTVAPQATSASSDAVRNAQQRWLALGVELLDKHRTSIDATYAAGIQLIEQTFRTSEAKSPEDYRRLTEELWRKLFEAYKTQSETQWNNFQEWSAKSAEAVRDVRT
ncbi:MAG TPA: hypothetical protein VH853_20885 [Polyangia bacterium]|jgi:hypothetical protein|nr:hypothetical protein [Polyangia bacterium]